MRRRPRRRQPPPATDRRRARSRSGQLVPGRRSVQPGPRNLPEHLRRRPQRRRLGGQLHPGVARAVADAPALVHASSFADGGQRTRRRRHAAQLSLSGAREGPAVRRSRRAPASMLPTGSVGNGLRERLVRAAGEPAVQQAAAATSTGTGTPASRGCRAPSAAGTRTTRTCSRRSSPAARSTRCGRCST